MKKTIYIIALVLISFLGINSAHGQSIWSNPISTDNAGATNPYTTGNIVTTNLTVSGIGRGSGITAHTSGQRYNAKDWTTATSSDANDFFYFTLTPATGYQINFTSFIFKSQRSSDGPTLFTLRSSRDSYTTDIIIPITAELTATESSIDLTSATFQSITDAVTFRVYAWSANASTGTYSIDDFTFNGAVVSSCATPDIPTGSIAVTEPTCGSKTFTYTETAPTGIQYFWQTTAEGIATSDEVTPSNNTKTVTTNDTSWYIRAQRTDGGCWSATIAASSGTLKTLPVFNTQPQDVAVVDGSVAAQNIIFTADVTAQTGTSYEWQINTGSGWTAISPADPNYLMDDNDLLIDQATTAMSGNQYRLRLINTPCESTSSPAILTVKKLPTIATIEVTYPSTSCGTAQIQVSATNTTGGTTGLSYTWYAFDAATDADWVTLTNSAIYSGATTATLTIASTSGLNNIQYYVRVQEGAVDCYKASTTVKTIDSVTTWNGSWSNGAPDLTKKVVIDSAYDTTTHGSFTACGCELTTSGTLSIGNGTNADYVILKNALTNSGSVVVNNNANLIQINDEAANTGTITVIRDSKPMNKYGYTYWGTPVSGQAMVDLYTGINNMLQWNQTTQAWVALSGNMLAPNGYIARAPQSPPWNGQTAGEWNRENITASFIGVPNNGAYDASIIADNTAFQPYEVGSKMSFIGNPYPSAIDIDKFFDDNTAVIIPTIYLWTHTSNPTLNGTTYSYASSDFAVYNGLGGVSTSPGTLPTGKVASGQGFFIRGNTVGGTATFNNTQRFAGTANSPIAHPNDNFFRLNNQSESASNTAEKHRFWLNLTGSGAQFKQTLVGYATAATDQLDNLDGQYYKAGNTIDLYTIIGTKELAIQSLALPFDDTDVVSLGYKVTTAGTYSFALEAFDNLFENQDIYIKDNNDLTRHNLKDGAFEFVSDAGEFTTRFEVVFRASDLSTDNPSLDSRWIVYTKANQLQLESLGFEMKDVVVYDMLGRTVYAKENLNTTSHSIDKLGANQVYIVKITTENNQVLVKKVSF